MATKKMALHFELNLPEELVETFESEEQASQEAKQAFVMDLLRHGKISQGKAAEVLGLDRWALMDLMRSHRIPAVELSTNELDDERARWHDRSPA
jgi:predicted HTH domain antitoxin